MTMVSSARRQDRRALLSFTRWNVTVTEQLAACLGEIGASSVSAALRDTVSRHLFDTLGAILAGLPLQESTALAAAVGDMNGPAPSGLRGPLGPAILRYCAAARSTEVDDIHLASCITPSSIIVPSALATAAHLSQATGAQLITACIIGYEAIIRLGLAINGPGILYQGLWPTYLCASIGSAATVSSLLGLTTTQTAQALAIAGAMAGGANARSDSPCAKWLMAGTAAQTGALSAFAARRGFLGDLGLLGARWGKLFDIHVDDDVLTAPAGERRHAASLAMKPWCGARQTMAAVAAFQRLLQHPAIAAEGLRSIAVAVPKAYLGMIDRKTLPKSRQESFADLRYQFALAAFAPDRLMDVARENLANDQRFATLAGKISIRHGAALDSHYPQHWPAQVTVIDSSGLSHSETALHAPGDVEQPLGWDDLTVKFARVTGRTPARTADIAAACQNLQQVDGLAALLTLMGREIIGLNL